MFATGTSAVLSELPVTVNEASGVSISVIVKARAVVGVSSFIVWSDIAVMVGRSLTAAYGDLKSS